MGLQAGFGGGSQVVEFADVGLEVRLEEGGRGGEGEFEEAEVQRQVAVQQFGGLLLTSPQLSRQLQHQLRQADAFALGLLLQGEDPE